MIFCGKCIENGQLDSNLFLILSHGIIECRVCHTKYRIKVREIIIVEKG